MDFDKYNKVIGKSKFVKVVGWFFLVIGIMVFISTAVSYFSWNSKKADYKKEYVYSNQGTLYYEENGKNVYVDKIYNTDDKVISLDIPDKETVIMYCSKAKNSECIYFDTNNPTDESMQNPITGLLVALFLIGVAVFFILKKRSRKEIDKNGKIIKEGASISSVYVLYIILFVLGIGLVGWQIFNAARYYNLKNENNFTKATIYSEIYNRGKTKNRYKSVSYYFVGGQKYIYVNDSYEEGTLSENLGKTFELYYNQNNPEEVSRKENPVNILPLMIGIGFSAFAFPFVFFKRKMEERLDRKLLERRNKKRKL